jgi:hypothetical protein
MQGNNYLSLTMSAIAMMGKIIKISKGSTCPNFKMSSITKA